jgi:hypothetical protein
MGPMVSRLALQDGPSDAKAAEGRFWVRGGCEYASTNGEPERREIGSPYSATSPDLYAGEK